MSISEMSVKKPVTALLVFIILSALGIYSLCNLNVDLYPDIDIPYMIVYTGYDNAGPEEVESSITRTLESSLSGLSGLKKMKSESSSGISLIILEMEYGTNLDETANSIRDKIDMVRSYLPEDADFLFISQYRSKKLCSSSSSPSRYPTAVARFTLCILRKILISTFLLCFFISAISRFISRRALSSSWAAVRSVKRQAHCKKRR